MEWYSARIGDPVAMRVLIDGLADEIRRARLVGRLSAHAQIYVVTEAEAVAFHFNAGALQVCPSLQRFALPAEHPPHPSERVNALIGPRPEPDSPDSSSA